MAFIFSLGNLDSFVFIIKLMCTYFCHLSLYAFILTCAFLASPPFLSLYLSCLLSLSFCLHYSSFVVLLLYELIILLLFFSQLFVRPPQTTIVPFSTSFSWGWSWPLPPVQCHEPTSIVLQALYLSDLIPWIYLSLPLYNHKGFDLGHIWMV